MKKLLKCFIFIEYFVFPIRFSGYKVEVSFVLVCLIIILTIMVGLYRDVYSLYVILYKLYSITYTPKKFVRYRLGVGP